MTDQEFIRLSCKDALLLLGYGLRKSWNPLHILRKKLKVVRISTGQVMGCMDPHEAAMFAYGEWRRLRYLEAVT
jgi:hypothetical protein